MHTRLMTQFGDCYGDVNSRYLENKYAVLKEITYSEKTPTQHHDRKGTVVVVGIS